MTGYVRADTANSIANGQTADADALDNEFDAIVAAFDSSTGHAHDGSSAEGSPIVVTGPAQDFVSGANAHYPKTNNLYDLGTNSLRWRDLHVSRDVLINGSAAITAGSTSTLTNKTINLGNNTLVSTSAQLLSSITDPTGTGALVFAASPTLTGTPTAPTAAAGTNTTQIASTAHVFAERTNTATLTNKTINLGNNTLVATSSQMAAAVTDETGSGSLVFANSPALTGVPTAPTATSGTNNTQIATTAFVVNAVVGGSVDPFPTGGIILWSGAIAAIPSGWGLCNGTSGTPDLRNRMVIGAGSTYAVGATGGATTATLSSANIPAHTHTFSGTSGAGGSHSHTGSTGAAGAHTHTATTDETGGTLANSLAFTYLNRNPGINSTRAINGVGDHTHTLSITAVGDHTHSFSGTTSAVGSGSSFSILNPYYALAYIMKV